ncbi:thiol-disulfide isomerase/thioredoxin [Peribacillus deserti]|uniref:Thiol-disulfide isomerase/thioredoxin n=1 Tax=Peribacillus deserti TaxID=673318 RepID=A0ABS2QM68_9BACI|nr:thioredoxin family protein [Peribacillus deserti]MBM7694261.1 thiol-disulfide isomerase/thioredoxin [Peribacillus deserti]
MKKVIIFLVIIIALFGGIAAVNNIQQKEKTADNPYGKKELNPATVDQLDDPNYKNLILPADLKEKLDNNEDATVYFYSSTCPHCKRTTPELMPLAKSKDIHIDQYNLQEFEQGWDDYGIESTPTLVQFKDGKETARIVGYNEKNVFSKWFDKYTLK